MQVDCSPNWLLLTMLIVEKIHIFKYICNAGEFGGKVDCAAFPTDIRDKRLPHLSFQDALDITAAFKGQGEFQKHLKNI